MRRRHPSLKDSSPTASLGSPRRRLSGRSPKTKYVSNITINALDGSIQITYGSPAQLAGTFINLTPQIQVGGNYTLLSGVGANSGNMDWGCQSVGNTTMANTVPAMVSGAYGAGTVLSKYAPTQCK